MFAICLQYTSAFMLSTCRKHPLQLQISWRIVFCRSLSRLIACRHYLIYDACKNIDDYVYSILSESYFVSKSYISHIWRWLLKVARMAIQCNLLCNNWTDTWDTCWWLKRCATSNYPLDYPKITRFYNTSSQMAQASSKQQYSCAGGI